MSNFIHETAVIDPTARIGVNVSIGPYSIIHSGVIIGDNTTIDSHCIMHSDTEIGDNNKIHDHVVIGSDPQDLKFNTDIRTSVRILNNNIIREYVSIHRSTRSEKPTQIFNNTMVMTNSHIGHDCIVGNSVIMSSASMLGGHVMIEDQVVLGANTLIHQHVRVGKLSMTAGGSRITRDVIPFMLLGRDPVKHYCINKIGVQRSGIIGKDYDALAKAFRLLKKGENIALIEPMTEDLQYLISWFSVKSERGHHLFI